MSQPSVFDLCREIANRDVMEQGTGVGLNAEQYRAYVVEKALEANASLPTPYDPVDVRYTAEGCASWARNNLLASNPHTARASQRAMARRRK